MRYLPGKSRFLLALSLLPLLAGAQALSQDKNALKAYQQASAEISNDNLEAAITDLKKAIAADPEFAAAHQQLGDVYRLTKNYGEAIKSYLKVIGIQPEFYRGTYLGLGESEFRSGSYSEALVHFTKYLAYPGISEENKKKVNKFITDCRFGIAAVAQPVPFTPVNLGPAVNTPAGEYLPVVSADDRTLIFTRLSGKDENFYQSKKLNGKWETPVPLNINTEIYNEGAQCLSPDGLYLFFTVCGRRDGLGSCDIYLSRREGSQWSEPFNLGAPVNTKGWESQPSISADGKTLYFTSNRAGGVGGYDLWKTELLEGGGWSEPVNLGPGINTPYDELSPFIHPDDQTLYFSSTGWPGLGDKDIFLSRKDTAGHWGIPVNLGYPINTFGEEAGITVNSAGTTAFFNAVRKDGFGGQDIYSFELPSALRPAPVTYVRGKVFDKTSHELLSAGLRIIDLSSGKPVYEDSSDGETGDFLATMPAGKTYTLTISKPGYVFYSANFTLTGPASFSHPFELSVPLEKIVPGASTTLRNVFFDSNRYTLLPDSKNELQQLLDFLAANPSVAIELRGYTDDVGDDKANFLLSENRAKAVYDFLLAKGVTAARLSFKGFGEGLPVADNGTEEGRMLNRRVEFVVK